MHACGYGRWRLVASTAGKTSLHRRGTHAGNTHKHGDNGKQSVYAVQLSASPILHIHRWKRVTYITVSKTGSGVALDVESGTRTTNKSRQIVARASRVKLCTKECAERHGATTHRQSCPDQTQSPKCVHSTQYQQGRKAQWLGPVGACGWGAPWPMAMRVGEPAGHKERVARPQSPDKTAHRLQQTEIERAGRESQTACELRRVMRTNLQGALAAKYASFPAVFTPYAISTRAMQDPLLCSSNCRRNCNVLLLPPPPPSPSLPPLPPPPLLPPLPVIKAPQRQQGWQAASHGPSSQI